MPRSQAEIQRDRDTVRDFSGRTADLGSLNDALDRLRSDAQARRAAETAERGSTTTRTDTTGGGTNTGGRGEDRDDRDSGSRFDSAGNVRNPGVDPLTGVRYNTGSSTPRTPEELAEMIETVGEAYGDLDNPTAAQQSQGRTALDILKRELTKALNKDRNKDRQAYEERWQKYGPAIDKQMGNYRREGWVKSRTEDVTVQGMRVADALAAMETAGQNILPTHTTSPNFDAARAELITAYNALPEWARSAYAGQFRAAMDKQGSDYQMENLQTGRYNQGVNPAMGALTPWGQRETRYREMHRAGEPAITAYNQWAETFNPRLTAAADGGISYQESQDLGAELESQAAVLESQGLHSMAADLRGQAQSLSSAVPWYEGPQPTFDRANLAADYHKYGVFTAADGRQYLRATTGADGRPIFHPDYAPPSVQQANYEVNQDLISRYGFVGEDGQTYLNLPGTVTRPDIGPIGSIDEEGPVGTGNIYLESPTDRANRLAGTVPYNTYEGVDFADQVRADSRFDALTEQYNRDLAAAFASDHTLTTANALTALQEKYGNTPFAANLAQNLAAVNQELLVEQPRRLAQQNIAAGRVAFGNLDRRLTAEQAVAGLQNDLFRLRQESGAGTHNWDPFAYHDGLMSLWNNMGPATHPAVQANLAAAIQLSHTGTPEDPGVAALRAQESGLPWILKSESIPTGEVVRWGTPANQAFDGVPVLGWLESNTVGQFGDYSPNYHREFVRGPTQSNPALGEGLVTYRDDYGNIHTYAPDPDRGANEYLQGRFAHYLLERMTPNWRQTADTFPGEKRIAGALAGAIDYKLPWINTGLGDAAFASFLPWSSQIYVSTPGSDGGRQITDAERQQLIGDYAVGGIFQALTPFGVGLAREAGGAVVENVIRKQLVPSVVIPAIKTAARNPRTWWGSGNIAAQNVGESVAELGLETAAYNLPVYGQSSDVTWEEFIPNVVAEAKQGGAETLLEFIGRSRMSGLGSADVNPSENAELALPSAGYTDNAGYEYFMPDGTRVSRYDVIFSGLQIPGVSNVEPQVYINLVRASEGQLAAEAEANIIGNQLYRLGIAPPTVIPSVLQEQAAFQRNLDRLIAQNRAAGIVPAHVLAGMWDGGDQSDRVKVPPPFIAADTMRIGGDLSGVTPAQPWSFRIEAVKPPTVTIRQFPTTMDFLRGKDFTERQIQAPWLWPELRGVNIPGVQQRGGDGGVDDSWNQEGPGGMGTMPAPGSRQADFYASKDADRAELQRAKDNVAAARARAGVPQATQEIWAPEAVRYPGDYIQDNFYEVAQQQQGSGGYADSTMPATPSERGGTVDPNNVLTLPGRVNAPPPEGPPTPYPPPPAAVGILCSPGSAGAGSDLPLPAAAPDGAEQLVGIWRLGQPGRI